MWCGVLEEHKWKEEVALWLVQAIMEASMSTMAKS